MKPTPNDKYQNKEEKQNKEGDALYFTGIQDPEIQCRLSVKSCTVSANWHYAKVSSTIDAKENTELADNLFLNISMVYSDN